MSWFSRLFGKGEQGLEKPRRTEVAEPASDSGLQVPATQVGPALRELEAKAKTGGWNLFGSVTVVCPKCGKAFEPKKHFLDRRLLQLVPASGLGRLYDLDQPFPCPDCKADILSIHNLHRPMKDWLRDLCDQLEASQ